ncbi:MAG: hypothetical protein ACK5JD_04185 [Mangrovibacterium sp.]
MTLLKWAFLLVLLAATTALRAQPDNSLANMLRVPLYFSGINPEHPAGIFSLDFPFYFPVDENRRDRLSVSYNMANNWHPQAWFYYPQNLTPEQQQLNEVLYMTWRPTYFKAIGVESKIKSFQSDGVLQHFRISWIRQWNPKNSFIINMNAHLLSGGSSPLHYPVSDRFIEWFHSNFAVDDNYGRRLFPFNRAFIQFIDEDGRTFRRDKGDVFTTVVDLHYYRRLLNHTTSYSNVYLQAGGHLSVPLNTFHPYLIPALSAGLRVDRLVSNRSSLTLAADAALSRQRFLKLGSGVNAIDKDWRSSIKLYFGANVNLGNNRVLQLGLLNNWQGALMQGSNNGWGQAGYPKIGMAFLQEGDTWEGEPVSQEFWLARITPAALYYFSYKAYFVVGLHRNNHHFNFTIGEDFFFINNAPDLQIGFEYIVPLSKN